MAKKVVFFARISPEAKAWAERVAKKSNGKEYANDVVDRLLLAHKKKVLGERAKDKAGKISAA